MTAHRERYQNYIFKLLDFFRLSLIFFFFFFYRNSPTDPSNGRACLECTFYLETLVYLTANRGTESHYFGSLLFNTFFFLLNIPF